MQIDLSIYQRHGAFSKMEENTQRRTRVRFTPQNTQYLETMYTQQRFPDKDMKAQIAQALDVTETQVSVLGQLE